jgi:hypothetical protein
MGVDPPFRESLAGATRQSIGQVALRAGRRGAWHGAS